MVAPHPLVRGHSTDPRQLNLEREWPRRITSAIMPEQAPVDGAATVFKEGNVVRHKSKRWIGTVDRIGVPQVGQQQLYIAWDTPGKPSVPSRKSTAASSVELVTQDNGPATAAPAPKQWWGCELTPTQSQALASANTSIETWKQGQQAEAAERLARLGLDIDGASGKWRISDNKGRVLVGYGP